MDLNAAHYPDKAGAVAEQWQSDWLDDSHTALTGRHSEIQCSSVYLMDPADRSSCTTPRPQGNGEAWKLDPAKPHNEISSSGPEIPDRVMLM